jgi:hypothetical protein
MEDSFTPNHAFEIVKFMDQNYVFFNEICLYEEFNEEMKRFKYSLEGITISLLLKNPLTYKNWKEPISKLIFRSNLIILHPFSYLLKENERNMDLTEKYVMKGIWWVEFLNLLIELSYKSKDMDAKLFIIDSISSVFT